MSTMTDNNDNLNKTIKQRRFIAGMTLQGLATAASVSTSHLSRIERGERFPSARVLHKIAKPLGFEETELFTLANYLSPQSPVAKGAREDNIMRLDPYAAKILAAEPVEVQRAVVTILSVLKSIAKFEKHG